MSVFVIASSTRDKYFYNMLANNTIANSTKKGNNHKNQQQTTARNKTTKTKTKPKPTKTQNPKPKNQNLQILTDSGKGVRRTEETNEGSYRLPMTRLPITCNHNFSLRRTEGLVGLHHSVRKLI